MKQAVAERYFVVNRYPGKNGSRMTGWEFDSHVEASKFAAFACVNLIELVGYLDEDFYVFVGSKSQLERKYVGVQCQLKESLNK